jgi:transcription elongation factor SPT5
VSLQVLYLRKKILPFGTISDLLNIVLQGKQGVVKHLYMGILFIYNESESENSGYFCAQCGSCENIKKRRELANEVCLMNYICFQ